MDETPAPAAPPAAAIAEATPPPAAYRPASPRGGRSLLLVALAAFIGGGVLIGWLAAEGRLDFVLERRSAPIAAPQAGGPADQRTTGAVSEAVGSAEARIALLEARLARLDGDAAAASGNATRAEGLLIAFAARRLVEKGAPLGYVADQLKLRFGDAQPNAVNTIIEAAKQPLTLDELVGRLDTLAPALANRPSGGDTWARGWQELSSLFVVRRDAAPSADPRGLIEKARAMLASGRVENAIIEVERMPGAGEARGWTVAARRYVRTQQALDLIETAAMLEPRRLQDDAGKEVDRPSPLAAPAQKAL